MAWWEMVLSPSGVQSMVQKASKQEVLSSCLQHTFFYLKMQIYLHSETQWNIFYDSVTEADNSARGGADGFMCYLWHLTN